MRLAPEALAQIVDILRRGITEGTDISQMLRDLDLVPNAIGQLIPRQSMLSSPMQDPPETD